MSKFAAACLLVILATTLLAACAARPAVSIEKLYDPPCPSASGILWAGPKDLVHSLFAETDEWDDQLEGTETGWPIFSRVLRLYHSKFRRMSGHSITRLQSVKRLLKQPVQPLK